MTRRTAYAAGRLVDNCPHRSGWTHSGGESRCAQCGTRRFSDYGALRPPGLASAVTPSDRVRRAADRRAARNVAEAVRRSVLRTRTRAFPGP
ncbi:DUF6255 family natural product biosynthesis protein [Streptomyces sp. NPDC026206]|uniref:DUF6255 family natural product biosynthesis protein n=1 Tax=Streptomyces sp. NPDC026206 TaxID=3157089 RepID=UPI0033E6B76E